MSATANPPDLSALSAWAPELARTFVSLASDIALVIDAAGVIREVAKGHAGEGPDARDWVGRPWVDTVSSDTRAKIGNLLSEVAATGIARRREVNHPGVPGSTFPIAYTAVRLGLGGPVLAVGRDMRTIAAIQQRFLQSQQAIERGYWQNRQAESRYQLLFQVATDAILVVDAKTLQVLEFNQAALTLFGTTPDQLRSRRADSGFEHHSRQAVTELLDRAHSTGQAGEVRARLQGTTNTTSVAATPFRCDGAVRLLMRVRGVDTCATNQPLSQTCARLVDSATDGVVVTDSSGRILVANPAVVALLGLAAEHELIGQPLMGWLGSAADPLAGLLTRVRREGVARHVVSWLRPRGRQALRVELGATLLAEGEQECIGFTIHAVAGAAAPVGPGESGSAAALLAEIERLGAQLGSRPLTALSGEATALIERHLAGMALQRCKGHLPTAAVLLGISVLRLVALQQPGAGADPAPAVATNPRSDMP